jgi:protein O-mannosyl-transferase
MTEILENTLPSVSRPRNPRGSPRAVWAASCALVLGVIVVFGPAIGYDFITCDDSPYVVDNPNVNTGLSWQNIRWAFTSIHSSNWHPLTWLSHILDVECYGLCAGGHHLTNIALHAAVVVLLFLALRRMTGAFWPSLFVAAMFAIHPLRVESVAWIAERKDVLSGLFWMLTLLLYTRYACQPSAGRRSAVLAVFAMGLMAKSMLVTLPGVLLLLDFWPLGRWRPKRFSPEPPLEAIGVTPETFKNLVIEKVPMILLAIIASGIVAAGQRSSGAMSVVGHIPLHARLANAAVSYVAYLWKMIWPVDLAILYPHPAVIHPDAMQSLLLQGAVAAIGLIAVTVWVLSNTRRRPYLAVGWFWYLGTLLPVIGIVQIGNQSLADRYTYLPMIGIYIMIVWSATDLASQSRSMRVALSMVAACVLLVWMAIAAKQLTHWRDAYSVLRHAIAVTDDNYFAHCLLGRAYEHNGQDDQALAEYEKAVGIAPNYVLVNLSLGAYWEKRGEYEKAERYLQTAVNTNPLEGIHRDLLNALREEEIQLNKTIFEFKQAIKRYPDDPQNCIKLADLLCKHGRTAEAIEELRRFLARSPGSAVIQTRLEQIQPSDEPTEHRKTAPTSRPNHP